MKSLVIGANGFLGSNLVNILLERGHNVTAVFNKNRDKKHPQAEEISFDQIDKLDSKSFNFVFYASGSFSSSYNELIRNCCIDLKYISDFFRDSKLIFISSTNVYGESSSIIDEKTLFNNPNTYGLSKVAGEFITKNHPKFAIIRLCYLYGPHLNNNSFIPRLMEQAKLTNKITLYGTGQREQDYLFIDDATELCYRAALHYNNEVFLGGTGISYTNSFIADLIKSQNSKVEIVTEGEEFGASIYLNPRNTFDQLKWKPKTSIVDGIKVMYNESFN